MVPAGPASTATSDDGAAQADAVTSASSKHNLDFILVPPEVWRSPAQYTRAAPVAPACALLTIAPVSGRITVTMQPGRLHHPPTMGMALVWWMLFFGAADACTI